MKKRFNYHNYVVGGKMQTTLKNYYLSYNNNYNSYDSSYDYTVYDVGFIFENDEGDCENYEDFVNEGEQNEEEFEEIIEA